MGQGPGEGGETAQQERSRARMRRCAKNNASRGSARPNLSLVRTIGMRDIEARQAAVQSAYGNCNLRELHHLRVPHAVDIAGSAISWSEAFIADRADAEDYLPQPADAEALPLDDLLDVILDDEDCVP